MVDDSRQLARDALRDLAIEHNGLFTRQQALDRGVSPEAVHSYVAHGRVDRVAHGIYRYPFLPGAEFEQYETALLRTGDPEAVLSHETALAIWEVSDVNPARYHVTVFHARRIRRADNDRYVVHEQALTPDQVTWWEQMPIVTVPTAIDQCVADGTPTYLLRQALERGARTGAMTAATVNRLTIAMETRDDPTR